MIEYNDRHQHHFVQYYCSIQIYSLLEYVYMMISHWIFKWLAHFFLNKIIYKRNNTNPIHQLSVNSVIVWACVSVVQSGDRSLDTAKRLRFESESWSSTACVCCSFPAPPTVPLRLYFTTLLQTPLPLTRLLLLRLFLKNRPM